MCEQNEVNMLKNSIKQEQEDKSNVEWLLEIKNETIDIEELIIKEEVKDNIGKVECLKVNQIQSNLSQQKCFSEKHFHCSRPYKCSTCSKSFKRQRDLLRHDHIHTGVRPYQCSICKKAFNRKSYLKIHERLHTGETPYPCTICSRSFSSKPHLRHHKRIHTGEKPCVCLICYKSFTNTFHLNNHTRVHTGEKPYPCTVCDQFFSQTSSLKRHVRNMHKTNIQ